MRSTCRGRRHAKQRVKARFLVKNWEENMARNLFACQNSLGSITVTSAIFDRPIWQAFTPMRHAYYTKHFGISLGTCHEPSTSHMLFNLQWDETVSIVALKDRRCQPRSLYVFTTESRRERNKLIKRQGIIHRIRQLSIICGRMKRVMRNCLAAQPTRSLPSCKFRQSDQIRKKVTRNARRVCYVPGLRNERCKI